MPTITCASWGTAGNIPAQFVGQTVRCKRCRGTILVADDTPIPVASATPATTGSPVFGFVDNPAPATSPEYAPAVVARSPRRFREPWYYSYCYRMTVVLLCLSLFGVLAQAAMWFWLSSTALMPDVSDYRISRPSFPREIYSRPQVTVDPNFVRGFVWFVSNFLMVFWSILVILWILYVFGFALIFIDAARWLRRYCSHALGTQ